jgi:epoxyqueuosine reductase
MIDSSIIKAEALCLGFFRCGISKAERISEDYEFEYRSWLNGGFYASMDYLNRNIEKRIDPRNLVPGVKSIVSVALNYAPDKTFNEGELKLASYALGLDYHDVVKGKLKQLAKSLGITEYRVFCDTAPVLERYWAQKSGIGWIGRNRQLVIPKAGSMFFLGELFISDDVSEYDSPCNNYCGRCRKCIDACPTGCLGHELFDAEKCLSYQTIENRGDLSELAKKEIGDTIYGCDKCLEACPWNRFAVPTEIEQFHPKDELLQMTREEWRNLTLEQYRKLFKGSAVKRAKYGGLKRNIDAALKEGGE